MSKKILKYLGFSQKTLWDWLELLIVPILILFATFYLQGVSQEQQELNQTEKTNRKY